jgi:hypothetical protein
MSKLNLENNFFFMKVRRIYYYRSRSFIPPQECNIRFIENIKNNINHFS